MELTSWHVCQEMVFTDGSKNFIQNEFDDVKEHSGNILDLSLKRIIRSNVLEHIKETIVMLLIEKSTI
jgi:hypothetical protein